MRKGKCDHEYKKIHQKTYGEPLLEVMLQDHSISIYLYQISAIQLTIRRLRKLRLVELKLQQAF